MVNLIQPEKIKKIVIFRTDRIGEVLLSTVCLKALSLNFKEAKITFVTSDYAKGLIENNKYVDDIYIFDTISNVKLMKLTSYLRKEGFDLAIILNPHKLLHLGCFLSGIKYRVGYNRKWGFCLTHKIPDKKAQAMKHEIEYNMDLLKVIGIDGKPDLPQIEVHQHDIDFVDDVIANGDLSNRKPIISIHPASSNTQKQWAVKNYALLIKKIRSKIDCNIALVGTEDDKPLISEIISLSDGGAIDVSGLFTIKQIAGFLKRSDIFIGNDAGPMHIAAAVNTKVIALFGAASSPKRWGPCGAGNEVIYKHDMNDITPDEVLEGVLKVPSLRGDRKK